MHTCVLCEYLCVCVPQSVGTDRVHVTVFSEPRGQGQAVSGRGTQEPASFILVTYRMETEKPEKEGSNAGHGSENPYPEGHGKAGV